MKIRVDGRRITHSEVMGYTYLTPKMQERLFPVSGEYRINVHQGTGFLIYKDHYFVSIQEVDDHLSVMICPKEYQQLFGSLPKGKQEVRITVDLL